MFDATSPDFRFEVHNFAGPFRDSALLSRASINVARLVGQPRGTVRIFAGQADPRDESHFTIDFQLPGGSGTIDGRLLANDSVQLLLRAVPTIATTAPGSSSAR